MQELLTAWQRWRGRGAVIRFFKFSWDEQWSSRHGFEVATRSHHESSQASWEIIIKEANRWIVRHTWWTWLKYSSLLDCLRRSWDYHSCCKYLRGWHKPKSKRNWSQPTWNSRFPWLRANLSSSCQPRSQDRQKAEIKRHEIAKPNNLNHSKSRQW